MKTKLRLSKIKKIKMPINKNNKNNKIYLRLFLGVIRNMLQQKNRNRFNLNLMQYLVNLMMKNFPLCERDKFKI